MAAKKANEVKPTKMFEVFGPYDIEPTLAKSARWIEKDQDKFWAMQSGPGQLRRRIGCYVFAIRASKGVRPVYVGKTWKAFEDEIFGSHQLYYYNAELADISKGTPVMFFVAYPQGKGITNRKMIRDVEEFLIQVAVAKNPDLRNVHNIGEKKWGIRGVIRRGKGKATESSTKFKNALGLHTS